MAYRAGATIEQRLLAAKVAIEGVLAALDRWMRDFNAVARVALAEV